jgi:O-methyltransferase involved in polyketide biosynthesis
MVIISGDTLEDVSATTLWTLHNRGTEAKRSHGVMRDFLTAYPRASVVALAEGLQTSFWRLDAEGCADELTWYSVDSPLVMALRAQLLPHDDVSCCRRAAACSRSPRGNRPGIALLEFDR